ncbi:MAG: class I SAM-dependent methyltransferase [Deltaproteobacteria bacterium]|nr:class I SAM-dependent methyltransferase [Deltaproteobacteria bacterium]
MLGRLIGRIMASETAAANQHALRLLRLAPTDRVLEVGFGPGRALSLVAGALPHGFAAGVDISPEMLRMASARGAPLIAAGRMALALADGAALPFPDRSFDSVYCIHVIYFWPQPRDQLREALRVLKPGGQFLLGFTARSHPRAADFPASVYRFHDPDEVLALLSSCAFRAITSSMSADHTQFVCGRR